MIICNVALAGFGGIFLGLILMVLFFWIRGIILRKKRL